MVAFQTDFYNFWRSVPFFKMNEKMQPRSPLWVGPYRGRCNMGAIEFFIPFLILNDFGAHDRIFFQKHSLYSLDLDDFGAPPHQCWRTCAQNASIPSSKSTLMKEGASKSSKNLQFWCKLLPTLLRPCSHGFSRPLCGSTHTGLRGRIFRSFWNRFQGAKNLRSLLENQRGFEIYDPFLKSTCFHQHDGRPHHKCFPA